MYKGTADALIRIYREEGVNGLYRRAPCPAEAHPPGLGLLPCAPA